MNTNQSHVRRPGAFFSRLLVLSFLLLLTTLAAVAQIENTNTIPPIANTVADAATPFIVSLAAKYTWLITILVTVGTLRLIMKPLIGFAEAIVKATPTTSDDAFLAKCEASVWFRWVMWALDWLGSIKPPSASTTNPALTKNGPTTT